MRSYDHIPADKVADYVERILVIEHSNLTSPLFLPLYANGTPTLLFQTAIGQIKGNKNHLTLFGQTVFPETLTIRENFILIAYFFKPFVLGSLFGFSPQELTDNPIDLNLLAPAKKFQLQEKLLNANSIDEMTGLLDDYIFSLITKVRADVKLIKHVTSQIAQNPFKEALLNVQKELFLTERSFQRMFEKNIGIAPNQYRRICQFNSAFNQLSKRKFQKLTDIAFENGYADQSHYIRAFREFTKITPTDFLNFAGPA